MAMTVFRDRPLAQLTAVAFVFSLVLAAPVSPFEGEGLPEEDSDIIVVTAEDIREMNVRSITDLLNRLPGISAGESVVRIRGSSVVRVLLDGRPINDPLSSHQAIRWNLVPFNSIAEVVIYKGGGGVLYGENTAGGVIAITTEKADDSGGRMEAAAGNLETYRVGLDYHHKRGPYGAGVSLNRKRTAGYMDNGDKDEKRAGLKLGLGRGEDFGVDLYVDYGEEERGIPGLPEFPTPEARSEKRTLGVVLKLERGGFRSRSYFNSFDKEHVNPEIGIETRLESRTMGEGLDGVLATERFGRFRLGASAEVAALEGNKVESRREEKYGLFVAKDVSFTTVPLTLSLGVRVNFHSDFPSVINPEIRAALEKKRVRVAASFSTTNNTPSFLQRYYETSTTRMNPDLGMERSRNCSLSLFLRTDAGLEGGAALFISRTEDRITYVRLDDGTGSYENLGEVTRRGADVSIKWRPYESLRVKSSYTYVIAKDDDTGNWMPYTPRHRVKLDIEFRPTRRATLNLDGKYTSTQFSRSDNSESVPPCLVSGLRAEYRLRRLRLFADVSNLFNNSYLYGDGFPGPPRTWLLGAGYEF